MNKMSGEHSISLNIFVRTWNIFCGQIYGTLSCLGIRVILVHWSTRFTANSTVYSSHSALCCLGTRWMCDM